MTDFWSMGKFFLGLLVFWVYFSFLVNPVSAAPPANFQTSLILSSGIDSPSGFEIAPDGRIFILERLGKVKIFKNGQLLPQIFTELPSVDTGDRGLVGITFDPDFQTNHFVYFYYTGTDLHNRLVRFDASTDVANNGPVIIYETQILSEMYHIGGTIRFGPDGKIYLSIGDNGNPPNAQDLSNPFGKIIRINKDGTIPSDNPFVGQAGKLPEIWAYGLRNPFRFQFDSATGRIFEGDVGQSTWEEINRIEKGSNYGWPTCEGVCNNPIFVDPIYAYNHNNNSAAVTGGPVYRGTMFPVEYRGNLFFGDYAAGFIKRLTLDSNGNSTGVVDFDTAAGSVVDLKVAGDGSLYYITYIPGRLYKITYSTGNTVPVANASADKTKGLEPLTVNFSSAGSYDPDGSPISMTWNFGDGTTSTNPNPTKTYNTRGTYTVILSVSDGTNVSQSVPIVIQVGVPPTLTIGSPINGALYKAGDTISYAASGKDGAGFDLPDNAYTTEVIFHHDTHIHPFLGPIPSRSGQFVIPTTGEPSANTWFEIKITGTDSNGLSTTKSVSIFPQKVKLTFATNPSGLQILIDGQPTLTPVTIEHVVGFQRQLSVPYLQDQNGKSYQFSSWSDSGGINHIITAPANAATYTANFSLASPFKGEYFNNITLSGSPVLVRQDSKIDFNWGSGSPGKKVPADNFSVRWSKSQTFAAGSYKFTTVADDGVRLYIDNNLVIDNWVDQPPTLKEGIVTLSAGSHNIRMEYYERFGGALAKLSYDLAPNSPPPVTTPGLKGEYFNNIDFTSPVFTRIDSNVNFNWGVGSPDAATIDPDTYSIRWIGQVQPQYTQTYTFYTTTDDGVRLWVNNQLIIDKWVNQPASEWSGTINLTAGQKYDLKMEYFENGGNAVSELRWSSPSQSKQVIPQANLFATP